MIDTCWFACCVAASFGMFLAGLWRGTETRTRLFWDNMEDIRHTHAYWRDRVEKLEGRVGWLEEKGPYR